MTFGNHEPDFGVDVLRKRMEQAQFPFVAANLRGGDGALLYPAYVIKHVGGVAVGILGLAYPKTPWTTAPKNVKDLDVRGPCLGREAGVAEAPSGGSPTVVVLSHLGLGGDKHLAEAVEGIDIIVGGHSHNRMEQAERVGKTLDRSSGRSRFRSGTPRSHHRRRENQGPQTHAHSLGARLVSP